MANTTSDQSVTTHNNLVVVEDLPPGYYYNSNGQLIVPENANSSHGIKITRIPADLYIECHRQSTARLSPPTSIESDPNYERISLNHQRALAVARFADTLSDNYINILTRNLNIDEAGIRQIRESIRSVSIINTMLERSQSQEYIYRRRRIVPSTNVTEDTAETHSNNDEIQSPEIEVAGVTLISNEDGDIQVDTTTSNIDNLSPQLRQSMQSFIESIRRLGSRAPQLPVDRGLTEQEMTENTQLMDGAVHINSYTEETPESQRMCSLCYDNYNEESTIRRLNCCIHIFHKTCVDRWLSNHRTCPMCRTLVISSDAAAAPTQSTTSVNMSVNNSDIQNSTNQTPEFITSLVGTIGSTLRQISTSGLNTIISDQDTVRTDGISSESTNNARSEYNDID